MNRLLLIFTGVAAVGIVVIAAIVSFQFTQEQNDRNRLMQKQEIQARQQLIYNMSLDEKAYCGLQYSQREMEIDRYGKAETPYSSYRCEIYASTIGK